MSRKPLLGPDGSPVPRSGPEPDGYKFRTQFNLSAVGMKFKGRVMSLDVFGVLKPDGTEMVLGGQLLFQEGYRVKLGPRNIETEEYKSDAEKADDSGSDGGEPEPGGDKL